MKEISIIIFNIIFLLYFFTIDVKCLVDISIITNEAVNNNDASNSKEMLEETNMKNACIGVDNCIECFEDKNENYSKKLHREIVNHNDNETPLKNSDMDNNENENNLKISKNSDQKKIPENKSKNLKKNTNQENNNENNLKNSVPNIGSLKCSKCITNYLVHEGRCYDAKSLNEFVNDLKIFSAPNQKAVIDYVMNSEKNILQNKFENEDNKNSNSRPKSFRDAEKNIFNNGKNKNNLTNVKEEFENLKRMSERNLRIELNEFMINFEQNMQTLMSLTNLFEQKTVYEIEKEKNSIIELLNSENVDSKSKLAVANNKLINLRNIISDAFDKIKNKIDSYENLSNQKIQRAKNSFLIKHSKFIN